MLKRIKFINNEYDFKSHQEENILQHSKFKTKTFNNILLISQDKGGNETNYNTEHAKVILSSIPENKTIINFLNSCVKNNLQENDYNFLIEDAFFFMTYAAGGHLITHILYDLLPQLNYFWKKIIDNPKYPIIIENCVFGVRGTHKCNSTLNIEKQKKNIQSIITYLRELNISNDIYIISNKKFHQFNNTNIWQGKLFVKNLNILLIENPYVSYHGLTSRYVLNSEGKVFNESLKNYINSKGINIHYNYHKKKFLILEKRLTSFKNPINKPRGFINSEWNSIVNLCDNYCFNNNLKLVIWDDNQTKNSIFEQQLICNNAEIIISTGGSFNLFNFGHNCSKMLILDISPRENCTNNIFKKICLNIFADHSSHTNLYYYFNHGTTLYFNIIKKFLYNK